jgi:hypothetical protein
MAVAAGAAALADTAGPATLADAVTAVPAAIAQAMATTISFRT